MTFSPSQCFWQWPPSPKLDTLKALDYVWFIFAFWKFSLVKEIRILEPNPTSARQSLWSVPITGQWFESWPSWEFTEMKAKVTQEGLHSLLSHCGDSKPGKSSPEKEGSIWACRLRVAWISGVAAARQQGLRNWSQDVPCRETGPWILDVHFLLFNPNLWLNSVHIQSGVRFHGYIALEIFSKTRPDMWPRWCQIHINHYRLTSYQQLETQTCCFKKYFKVF